MWLYKCQDCDSGDWICQARLDLAENISRFEQDLRYSGANLNKYENSDKLRTLIVAVSSACVPFCVVRIHSTYPALGYVGPLFIRGHANTSEDLPVVEGPLALQIRLLSLSPRFCRKRAPPC